MKKTLTIIVVALICAKSFAQGDFSFIEMNREKPVACRLGFVAGASMSSFLSSSGENQFSMKPGFSAGVVFNMRFLKRNDRSNAETGLLAFQPEIKFSMIGASNPKVGLSYVNIPLMFQVYPIKNMFIEVGPEIAMNVAHSPSKVTLGSGSVVDLSKLKANDLMIGVGLGYSIKGFSIGARGNIGTSKVAGNLPWKNLSIELNVGYAFSLKKKEVATLIIK